MVVSPYFYPKPGGLENYARNITVRLARKGHRVVVVCANDQNRRSSFEEIDGMRICRLPIQFMVSNTPVSINWVRIFRSIIEIERPDIINAHTPVPFMADACERARKETPFVLTYHNDLVKQGVVLSVLARMAYVFGIEKTMRRSNAIIATSLGYVESSKHLRPYVKKISIVTPGVDLAKFTTNVDKTWLKSANGDRFTVLFVGRLDRSHRHKGLEVLLEATALLQRKGIEIRLVVVGEGDGIAEYCRLARTKGAGGVRFVGFVDGADLPKYFAGADVTVLPSVTRAEGFGMVLLEANACGRPVIGSDIGGIPQAVQDGRTGLLVEPNNPTDLAAALARLYEDPILAQSLGSKGAARVRQDFDWDRLADETESIFLKTMRRGPS
jgi:glycosyltransferase involved in cell wall biosynthesis